jgi:homoserine dehydrogenase
MSPVEVLKFGSSVLRTPDDLPVAVDEIYRRWRSGCRVLAVVSAFEGVTDRLFTEADKLFGADLNATAAFVAAGEERTATLLVAALVRCGMAAQVVDPKEIRLLAQGTSLESTPQSVDVSALERFWRGSPILVLPGFYGIDERGRRALFGRGGSDMSALFLAAELRASCRLLKDVSGVFNADPASSTHAHRFMALTWATAIEVAGPLIQAKALRYAQSRALPFDVGRPNESACTRVGQESDEWAAPVSNLGPLKIALLGCGVVGRGVYDLLKRHPARFTVRHVVVGNLRKYAQINEATTDLSAALEEEIDVVVECFGGVGPPYPLITTALRDGKFVVTANKALVAARWEELRPYARDSERRLWYSAAVGGVLPAVETCERLATTQSVREIRGIVNGTCGVVLDQVALGKTRDQAVALAQAGGFAEADPARDLSGEDAADKLALLVEAAFGEWLAPASIATQGIDTIPSNPRGYKLIARARRERQIIRASVAPEVVAPESFLGQARGANNRIEIEMESGEVITLCGQGAGRWSTAVSVMGDVHEVARLIEGRRLCAREGSAL